MPARPPRHPRPDISLREARRGDIPVFFAHQCDPEACRMAGFPTRDLNTFTAHWQRILDDPAIIKRAILADGALAGNIVCFPQKGRRLIGYWIGASMWGRGIASAALRLFLAELPPEPLHAWVAFHNAASIRVLEKCGFRRVDEAHGEYLYERRG